MNVAKDNKPCRIGIAGLGNIGAYVVRLLQEKQQELSLHAGRELVLTVVSARDRSKDRDLDLSNIDWEQNAETIACRSDVDIVVELIGGNSGSASALSKAALSNAKDLVSANKALLAKDGLALGKLAESKGALLRYEAAVAGGIPIIKTLREALAVNEISSITGVLNGTSNYILAEMEKSGQTFAHMLKNAQSLGYAEADPAFDINGTDAAQKLTILSAIAFSNFPNSNDMHIEGIEAITPNDMRLAAKIGDSIRLLGVAKGRSGEESHCWVRPCLVKSTSFFGSLAGVDNAISIEGNLLGELRLQGAGAGPAATASAVVADIIDIAKKGDASAFAGYTFGRSAETLTRSNSTYNDSFTSNYFVRITPAEEIRPEVILELLSLHGITAQELLSTGEANYDGVVALISNVSSNTDMSNAMKVLSQKRLSRAQICMPRIKH